MLRTLPRLALSAFMTIAGFAYGQALAADAKAVADALVLATDKGKASYESAVANGDDITITGFKVTDGEETTTLPAMTITGAVPREAGGFTAAKVRIEPGSMTARGQTVAWQSVEMENMLIPSEEEAKHPTHITPFSKLDARGVTLTGRRFPVPVDVASFAMSLAPDDKGNPRSFAMNLDGLKIPPEFFARSAFATAYLGMLGYTSGFTVGFAGAGSYETATDTLALDGLSWDVSDVGKFSIAGKFSGVSLREVGSMQVGRVQSTGKLENLKIRFENHGLVERLLDMHAKTQGITKEEAIAQATAALGFFMLTIPDEAFSGKLLTAATAFLADPKSLTISAAPKEPVPFETLYDTLGETPEELPTVIGADVTAND